MTISEFYETIGGNYNEALNRLMSETLIKKFVLKFKDDKSFSELKENIEKGDLSAAFTSSHTLKGVALNLSFKKLGASAVLLTDMLRPANVNSQTPESIRNAFDTVSRDYETIIKTLSDIS